MIELTYLDSWGRTLQILPGISIGVIKESDILPLFGVESLNPDEDKVVGWRFAVTWLCSGFSLNYWVGSGENEDLEM